MNQLNKLNAIFIAIIGIALVVACGGGMQTEEANKVVDAANKKLDDGKVLYDKTEERNKKLFSADVRTVRELQYYKEDRKDEAKSIVTDYEKTVEIMKDVSREYDNISRMNLDEKYKEYAKLKSDEYLKRAEAINIRKGNAQAFMEIDDYKTMTTKFDDNNAKSERLFKDADEIATKAKKIEEDHKEIFKQA